MAKKPLAVFTIARNEAFFLPRWLAHYGTLGADVFVLDHESDDGSTAHAEQRGFRVFPVERPHTDDVGWMLQTVESMFLALCTQYERVIFAEVDEFLVADPAVYSGGLGQYLATHTQPTRYRATGYDVVAASGDPPFDPTRPILSQRGWKHNDRYSKTLIASAPIRWEVGFHKPVEGEDHPAPDPTLLLVHLHYFDPEVAWDRLVTRMAGRTPHPSDWGRENKIRNRDLFDHTFAQMASGGEPVPERFRGIL